MCAGVSTVSIYPLLAPLWSGNPHPTANLLHLRVTGPHGPHSATQFAS